MVNAETSSVIATLIFNGVVGTVILSLFEYFRRSHTDVYAPKIRRSDGETIPNPGKDIFSWIKPVMFTPDEDIITIAGMDAYVHIRFLKTCFDIMLICVIFSTFVLCPIYATSFDGSQDRSVLDGITMFSMANIPQGSDRLWSSWLFVYVFTFVFLYHMHKEYENFTLARIHYFQTGDPKLPLQMSYSVQVENIPLEYRTASRLKLLFESLFGDNVLFAHVATILTPLDNLIAERKALLVKLEGCIAAYEGEDLKERPQMKLLHGVPVPFGGNEIVDAIDYLYDRIRILNEEIYVLQLEAKMIAEGPTEGDQEENKKLIEAEIDLMRRSISKSDSGNEPKDDEDEEGKEEKENDDDDGKGRTNGKVYQEVDSNDGSEIDGDVEMSKLPNTRNSIGSEKRFSTRTKGADKRISMFIKTYKKQITSKMISGTGFVTFKSRRTQADAAQLPVLSAEHPRMKVLPAPELRDIVWNNMSASTDRTEYVSLVTSIMYYVGLIFWSVILAFIAAISNLSNLEPVLPFLKSLDPSTHAILQGLFPVIVMVIFLALVPIFMACVARYVECRKTFSRIQQEVFGWYFLYQLANVYLLLLAGSAFGSLSNSLGDPTSIVNAISAALPLSSIFFINYILTQAFVGIPMLFLRIAPLLILHVTRFLNNDKKLNRRSLMEGPLADTPVAYGTTLPNALYILCISLLYWVISPPIVVVSVLFYGCCYIAWKYQYMYVIVRNFESGGKYWYGLYNYAMTGLLASTITILAYMSIKEGAVQAPLLIPLPFIVVMAWRYTEGQFKVLSENVPFSVAVAEDEESSAYEEIEKFTEDYLKPPSLLAPKVVYPYPHRIDDIPIIDENGLVNSVYLDKKPETEMMPDGKGQHIPAAYRNQQQKQASGTSTQTMAVTDPKTSPFASLDSDINLGVWTIESASDKLYNE